MLLNIKGVLERGKGRKHRENKWQKKESSKSITFNFFLESSEKDGHENSSHIGVELDLT